MNITLKALVTLGCIMPISLWAQTLNLTSPDGKITLTVTDTEKPSYAIAFNGNAVIEPSALGMSFKHAPAFDESFSIKTSTKNTHKSTWQLPWGERKNVLDEHNELLVTFHSDRKQANTYHVRFRLFNDGLGFRYEVPSQSGLDKHIEITNEATAFNIAQRHRATAWWIPARGWNRYEYTYTTSGFDKIDRVHTPFTFKNDLGVHVSIHEAALVDYASMTLNQGRHGQFEADLTPWSDGIKVKTQANFKTPWRTLQISDNAVAY